VPRLRKETIDAEFVIDIGSVALYFLEREIERYGDGMGNKNEVHMKAKKEHCTLNHRKVHHHPFSCSIIGLWIS